MAQGTGVSLHDRAVLNSESTAAHGAVSTFDADAAALTRPTVATGAVGFRALKSTSDFATVGNDAWDALISASTRRLYGNNEVIYLQEEPAQHLHFVMSGHVRLSYVLDDGSAILYAILPVGASFGELGVFDGGVHCDMATGIGATIVGSLSAAKFNELCGRFPQLQDCIAHLIARRYRSYVDLTRLMSLKTLHGRVAQALLRLADGLGSKEDYDGHAVPRIGPMVTQADIGLMARGARGSVNRTLKAWERAGWVVSRDRAILIVDRRALETVAMEQDCDG
ncbi:cAMP-binding protein [Bradyrhizobium sp. Y36]|nr:cAMP-binding protein [Bradyrhizobium sp. Y36]